MRRLIWLGVFWGGMLILAACGSDDTPAVQPSTDGDGTVTATGTPQPTLDINEISVLGEENPPPPVPLEVNDPRYPIQPAEGDLLAEDKQFYSSK